MQRAERRSRTERIVERRRRQWNRKVIQRWDSDSQTFVKSEGPPRPGRAKKHSHFDCGRSGCIVCHHAKQTREPRRQELLAIGD